MEPSSGAGFKWIPLFLWVIWSCGVAGATWLLRVSCVLTHFTYQSAPGFVTGISPAAPRPAPLRRRLSSNGYLSFYWWCLVLWRGWAVFLLRVSCCLTRFTKVHRDSPEFRQHKIELEHLTKGDNHNSAFSHLVRQGNVQLRTAALKHLPELPAGRRPGIRWSKYPFSRCRESGPEVPIKYH